MRSIELTVPTKKMKSIEHLRTVYRSLLELKLKGISDGEIAAHFQLMPESYFVNKNQAVILQHLLMINALRKTIKEGNPTAALLPIIEWKNSPDQSFTEVTIVTEDRVGLFYKLAGAFSLAGLTILSAQAISRSDHIAIDTFYVIGPEGGSVRREKTKDAFYQVIDEVLVMNTDLSETILAQNGDVHPPHLAEVKTGVTTLEPTPNSVEIYQEISLHRTNVELHACDKIGLLFILAKTISDHGYDITFARIRTERGIASDTFHITWPSAQTSDDRLHELRTALIQAISPAPSDTTCCAATF